ncbi:MAG: alpha/beta hydrolase [Phycisphaerales bacterium]|nr:alpha/beta hydrolase [Phycisphaerales bacterium]
MDRPSPRLFALPIAAAILGASLTPNDALAQAPGVEAPAAKPAELPAWAKVKLPKAVPIQASSVRGHGPMTLLIIAEVGADETAYEAFADRHAERFTTHTICLPGTTKGTSGPQLHRGDVNDPEWLLNAVNAVTGYVRDKKLEKPVVLGHSLGGMVAYMLSVREPQLAGAYVIVNMLPARGVGGAGRIPPKDQRAGEVDTLERARILEMTRSVYLNKVRDTVPMQCRDRTFSDTMINMYSNVSILAARRYQLESLYLDLREDLDTVRTPMLVIATLPDWFERRDREVLRAAFQNVGFNRSNVRVEILDNTLQWGIIEEPKKFDPPLLAFLGLKGDDPQAEQPQAEKPATEAATQPGTAPASPKP